MTKISRGRVCAAVTLLAAAVFNTAVAQERSSNAGSAQGQAGTSQPGQTSNERDAAPGAAASGRSAVTGQTGAGGQATASGQTDVTDRTQRERRAQVRGEGGQVREGRRTSTTESVSESRSAASSDRATGRDGLDQKIAHWLIIGNMAEVTMGQFAAQRAQNDSVKQFAQHMVHDHSQAIEQLQQAADGAGAAGTVGTTGRTTTREQSTTTESSVPRTTTERQTSRPDSSDSSSRAQESTSELSTALSGQPAPASAAQDRNSPSQARSSGTPATELGQADRPSAAGQTRSTEQSGQASGTLSSQAEARRQTTPGGQTGRLDQADRSGQQPAQPRSTLSQDPIGHSDSSTLGSTRTESRSEVRTQGFRGEQALTAIAPGEPLLQMKAEIARRCGELTQRELAAKQGAEFDKAYIGQQIVSHIDMLATLQTVQQHASSELQPMIQKGIQTTEQHLSQAKQIMQQLDGRTGGAESPSRATSGESQRDQQRAPSGVDRQSSGQPTGN